ncbi:hypothetical protein BABINDRAFT_6308 [Babjeviella inositovora NRRL Y-12698]|uniref:Uncharacterized protein n=1 Tax=Babjeviella inositovora NRRL Y-12698 TaxID=984486 RepID=A0A1E3QVE5_9ASCO|nr:uncharacterized protein BABINDRAFT_6308 [Babjeviella inositovora NRRL Y-12698]ODQ81630.1 hypothetical protein BABINDRAFT_6308 [Babjeviella inositovora NRRL Y-12698]
MEATPSDDIMTITALLKDLSLSLAESREKTNVVESLTKLVETQRQAGAEPEDTETSESLIDKEIERLEAQRMELIMDLQRLEFINKQLHVVLSESETVMTMLTDFLKSKDLTRLASYRNQNYLFNSKIETINSKIDLLRYNLKLSQSVFVKVRAILKHYLPQNGEKNLMGNLIKEPDPGSK